MSDARLTATEKIVLSVLVFSALVMFLNETILSVALTPIMEDLSIPATTAQWLTTGFMLTMAVVIPTTGFLLERLHTRTIFFAALISFTTMNEDTSAWGVVARHVLFSIGLGLSITPLMTTALGSLTDELYGHGSAAFNTLQQLGGALGTALLVMALNMGTMAAQNGGAAASEAVATGTQVAFLVGTVFAVLALILAPRVRPVGQHAAS